MYECRKSWRTESTRVDKIVFDGGVHRSNLQNIGAGAGADSNVRTSVDVYDNLLMHINTAKGGQSVI